METNWTGRMGADGLEMPSMYMRRELGGLQFQASQSSLWALQAAPRGRLEQIPYERCQKGSQEENGWSFSQKTGMMWLHRLCSTQDILEKTFITRTRGTQTASIGFKGHTCEVHLANLQDDDIALRKFRLITEYMQGISCLPRFRSMVLPATKCAPWSKNGRLWSKLRLMSWVLMVICFLCAALLLLTNHSNQIQKTSAQH